MDSSGGHAGGTELHIPEIVIDTRGVTTDSRCEILAMPDSESN
jgi:hypothetical protein